MNPRFAGHSARIALTAGGLIAAGSALAERYVAELRPMNADAVGRAAEGTATFEIDKGQLDITVDATGLAPGVMHLQHYHGFPDGQEAACPSQTADTNGDGYIDLLETEDAAGTTMVPLHARPQSLELSSDPYPVASDQGAIGYEQSVAVDELTAALENKFTVSELSLEDRVVILHGILPEAELPDSVRSLPGVPAQVTLPVACGTIEAVE